ncbi:ankyrin repeat protein [Leptodontidium sp. MPI-SDFR-AT-0119]|nr:ankyrin repeat protein [Leptodontidium sp. MPI-SDFR-AT-0119]
MSVVALGSTSRTVNTDGSVTKSLEIALSEFGSVLTDNERKQLQQIKGVPDAAAALVFTAKLDASNSTRRGKSIGARAYSMLQSIQQFSTIVETFVSSHPDIAALVWGSVKLTILIESIQSCANDVKKAIALAKATSDRKEQECQEQERKRAAKHRNQLSIFASRSQKELESTREWQMQRDQDLLRGKKTKLLDSLSTYAHQMNFHQARKKRHVNTATWLFSTPEFAKWKDSEAPSVFILTGKPLCNKFSTFYIVIDALDEFEKEERNVLLRSLSSIISIPNSKAKLFLVGRSSVSTDIRRWFPASQEKSTNCREVQADIEAYTRETITLRQGEQLILQEQVIPQEQLILQDPALAQEIIEALIDGANGMFLWVDYQIAEICECTCDDEIREVLRTLPKNLGETFDRAMKRIVKRGSAKTASHIFQWAAATKRALTLDMLREALSYEPGIPYSIRGKRPSGLERITAWCENLVQLDEELQIVQFTHRSVLQHLLEQPSDSSLQSFHIKLEEADHFIGEICVTYLNSNDFKTDLIRNPAALPTRLPNYIIEKTVEVEGVTSRIMHMTQRLHPQSHQKSTNNKESMIVIKNSLEDSMATLQLGHPFLEYALDYWLLHTRNFEEGKSITWNLWKQMIRGSHGLARTPWSQAEFHDRVPAVYEWIDKHDHFAVFLQIVSIAGLSSTEGDALMCHYAVLGRLNYINILINFVKHEKGLSQGLLHAAKGGHLEVVERLLDAKADVNAAAATVGEGGSRTALQAAAEGGHLDVVQRLLDAKADVNAVAGWRGRTALQAAAGGGHLEVVQRLLDAKADVNAAAADNDGRTALQAAVGGGHLEVLQRLLDAKADVNAAAANSYGRTALQAAAGGGHLEVVQRLLDAKADVNAAAAYGGGRTALQAAAEGGHLEVLQRLLDAKANVNAAAADWGGRTALQAAAGGGHLEVVQRLLDAKANVNATASAASNGRTALQAAAEGGHLEVVQRLLNTKADVNAAAAYGGGRTALQAAAEGGYLEIVQRLLDAKADVNAVAGWRGRTALQAAAGGGHLEVVQRLLDAKANVNATASAASNGRTALQAAAEGGHLEVVQRLLNTKADVNAAAAWDGRTALQAAAEGGHLDVVQRLLDAKADVNAVGPGMGGRTALQAAAEGGHLEIIELLKSFGACI